MKKNILLTSLALGGILLTSCGTTVSENKSESGSSSSEGSSFSSSEVFSETLENETAPDKSDLPYLATMEHLKKTDWTAKWIWEKRTINDTHVAFRKNFTLKELPSEAIAHIASEAKFTLWVNGTLVVLDGNLKRGASYVDSFYQDYDLAPYLKKGNNNITALVEYWGQGGNASVFVEEQGGFLFEMNLGDQVIRSDNSFKVKRLNSYRNKRLLVSAGEDPNHARNAFLAEPNIYYDARQEIGPFFQSDFDDRDWDYAHLVATPGMLPFGDTYLADILPFAFDSVEHDMTPLTENWNVQSNQARTLRFALPCNMQFYPYLELSAEEGKRITFYTDTKDTDGIPSFIDDYVTKGGNQSYLQYSWRSGRELILEVPAGVNLKRVGYRKTNYQTDRLGRFESGIQGLDVLYEKAVNTVEICMRDTFMDCPERERSPYSGDGANQMGVSYYAFGPEGWRMAKKTFQTLAGWVKSDAIIPTRWPSSKTNECPVQNLAFIATAPDYYLHTGDEQTLKDLYELFYNYVSLWSLNEDGTLISRPGTFPWFEWGSKIDSVLLENEWYFWALSSLVKMGNDFQMMQHVEELTARMARLKEGFKTFETAQGFTSIENQYCDRVAALAVLSGIAEETTYPKLLETMKTTYNASPYMERFVLEALGKLGEYELAKERMLNRYQRMIDSPIETLWELWDSGDLSTGTYNHGWSAGPLITMSKYLAGIRPLSSGFATYEIELTGALHQGTYQVATPKGSISYSISETDQDVSFHFEAPESLLGTIRLDTPYASIVSASDNFEALSGTVLNFHGGQGTLVLSKA